MYTHTHSYTNTHTHIHTQVYIYIYIYIYIYTHTIMQRWINKMLKTLKDHMELIWKPKFLAWNRLGRFGVTHKHLNKRISRPSSYGQFETHSSRGLAFTTQLKNSLAMRLLNRYIKVNWRHLDTRKYSSVLKWICCVTSTFSLLFITYHQFL